MPAPFFVGQVACYSARVEPRRETGFGEIEVTPPMVEAGARLLRDRYDLLNEAAQALAEEIFRSMMAERCAPSASDASRGA